MAERRLKTLEDVRRYMSFLIRRVEKTPGDKKMDAAILAGKLCYMANSLAKVIENSTLEKRLEKIEEHLNVKK
jgi:hypothetical protein